MIKCLLAAQDLSTRARGISLSLIAVALGERVVYVVARLQPSLDFISPGWILFEGIGVRKRRGSGKGRRRFLMLQDEYVCPAPVLGPE